MYFGSSRISFISLEFLNDRSLRTKDSGIAADPHDGEGVKCLFWAEQKTCILEKSVTIVCIETIQTAVKMPTSLPSEIELAKAFCLQLQKVLSAIDMADVIAINRANKEAGNNTMCATHEFCDPNECMNLALGALGLSFTPDNQKQAALVEGAWDLANSNGFTFA